MISLSDHQLKLVMAAARAVPHEKRDVYLRRVAALMQWRTRGDADVAEAVRLALFGLVHETAA